MACDHEQQCLDGIVLSTSDSPGFTHAPNLTDDSAAKASELMTLNHTLYHTRFNGGFHNHIAHQLLAMWSLGALPDEMQAMWDYNRVYQAPLVESHDGTAMETIDLHDPAAFEASLGNNGRYHDFLNYFKDEIRAKGGPAVLKEYVFQGDARADDIFCRMYTDLVHPMIHLGYAIEYNQPSLIAEALAAACIHDNWPKKFLLPAEEASRTSSDAAPLSAMGLLEAMRADPVISNAVKDDDPFNKIRDGLLARVGASELTPHLSRFRVQHTEADINAKLRDMMYTGVYSVGAAQRPGKRETFDFVLLHNVTLSVFYPAMLSQEWLSLADQARLLEGKVRMDAVMYAACACPQLFPKRIQDYKPLHPEQGWTELFHRANNYFDEGHIVKAMRAFYALEKMGDVPSEIPIAKEDVVKVAHMMIDSAERAMQPGGSDMPQAVKDGMSKMVGQGGDQVVNNHMRFVFYGGTEKAWKWIPDLQPTV